MQLFEEYSQEANQYIQRFQLTGAHNGRADAFRHAYVSAAMSQDYGKLAANLAGQAHELKGTYRGNQPDSERHMDLFNNRVGRDLSTNTVTRDQIANKAFAALNGGDLMTAPRAGSYDPMNIQATLDSSIQMMKDTMKNYGGANPKYGDLLKMVDDLNTQVKAALQSDDYTQAQKDAIVDKVTEFSKTFRTFDMGYHDPLVIDLDGDGVETVSPRTIEGFDIFDGTGMSGDHGWIGGDDAFLAIDKNADGIISGVDELFGSSTTSGFDALSQYDSDANGKINNEDIAFDSFRIWQDRNGDGFSTPDEISTLSDIGIVEISLAVEETSVDNNGNLITGISSVTFSDGSSHDIADVNFLVDRETLGTNNIEDVFVFSDAEGSHRIDHFEDGIDLISMSGVNFDSLNIFDSAIGARIEISGKFALTITNVEAAQLNEQDFIFT